MVRQHGWMDPSNYLLPIAADSVDLSPWASLLPSGVSILRTNLFGDMFLTDEIGAVHMLERAACSVTEIAPSTEYFWRALAVDEEGW